jgi:hypothetical protein
MVLMRLTRLPRTPKTYLLVVISAIGLAKAVPLSRCQTQLEHEALSDSFYAVNPHRNNLLEPSGSCGPCRSSSAPVCVAEPRLECHYVSTTASSIALFYVHCVGWGQPLREKADHNARRRF